MHAKCQKLIYAVNAGGKEHVDENMIYYQQDPLGLKNVYNEFDVIDHSEMNLMGSGLFVVSEEDKYLYVTNRQDEIFTYEIPMIVLKFGEPYDFELQRIDN